jgi:hypothetical protein
LFDTGTFKKLEIVIDAGSNPDGYVEVSRIIVGHGVTPEYGPALGAAVGHQDSSVTRLLDNGDSSGKRGTMRKTMSLNFNALSVADKRAFTEMIRRQGANTPIFMSMYETSEDGEEAQTYMIYGKWPVLPQTSAISYKLFGAPVQVVEI